MQVVLDTGVFTQRNKQTINDNFATLTNPDFWVRPQGPNARNTNPGTYESPFANMDGVTRYLTPGITIGLTGTLFQNWSPPAVNDITIVGMGNTPRQSTDSGIPNGGGATWLNVTHTGSATATSLLKIGGAATELKVSQAWRLVNLFMNNASTTSTTACVELHRGDGAGVDVGRDASHFSMLNCILTGGNFGLLDQGGCSFVVIDNCVFFNCTKASTGTAITEGTDTDVALPLQWKITNSRFLNNTNHIVMPFSSADIHDNTFGWLGSSTQTVKIYDATGGKNNTIWRNKIQAASDAANITAAVTLGTTDSYGPQYYTDKEEYATPSS